MFRYNAYVKYSRFGSEFDELEKLLPKNIPYSQWHTVSHPKYSALMINRVTKDTILEKVQNFYGMPFELSIGCNSREEYFLVFVGFPMISTETIWAKKLDTGKEVLVAAHKFMWLSYKQVFDENGEPALTKNTAGMLRLDKDAEGNLLDPVFPIPLSNYMG